MKVVYAKTIFEKINDAIRDAEDKCKEIEYIELTKSEWVALTSRAVCFNSGEYLTNWSYDGVLIKVVDNE